MLVGYGCLSDRELFHSLVGDPSDDFVGALLGLGVDDGAENDQEENGGARGAT